MNTIDIRKDRQALSEHFASSFRLLYANRDRIWSDPRLYGADVGVTTYGNNGKGGLGAVLYAIDAHPGLFHVGDTRVINFYGSPLSGTTVNKAVDILTGRVSSLRVKLGGKWRMPTLDEFSELRKQCTWTWVSDDEKAGFQVTSKKTGKSIFLPAAGERKTDLYSSDSGEGRMGNFWTSSLYKSNSSTAYEYYFNSGYNYHSTEQRAWGLSIRPVYAE